jgi:hypothetical protein
LGFAQQRSHLPLGKALYDKRSPHFAESIRRIIHSMNWKDYEKEIYQQFKDMYPTAEITYDAKVLERYSKVDRQIDIDRRLCCW